MTAWKVSQIDRQIPPIAHTSLYNWHKYWARKTWNVVGGFVESYCPPRGVVLDPFAGSGVTGIEALRRGRRAVPIDIVPMMEEIVWATLVDVDPSALERAFDRVAVAVEAEILSLYETQCPTCGLRQPSWVNVWEDGFLARLRYVCARPTCGVRHEHGVPATEDDLRVLAVAGARVGEHWYPNQRLEYPDGQPFLKREKYRTLSDLFTPRNLAALSMVMNAIDRESDRRLRRLLAAAFTSMVHLASRMVPVMDPSEKNHHTPFSAIGWQQQSYWSAPRAMEKNVWQLFESAVRGHQGLLRAKQESKAVFPRPVAFAPSADAFLRGEGDILLHTGDSTAFLKRLPPGSVDYVFTDPPYDVSIQYGELAFLWVAWLRKDAGYLDRIGRSEVIRNERQHKTANVYQAMLRGAFQGTFQVLKDDAYLTVTFHNPSLTVRKATIEAGTYAGFLFEKIHHQPTAVRSAKSLLQPFGSAQGDFYLRFHKRSDSVPGKVPGRVDDARFERIVVDTTKEILAERGEPTAYTFIINKIDPELAKRGFFSSLTTGLDVKTVLTRHLDQEFALVKVVVDGVEGQLWWFRDPSVVAHAELPLSERVDATVLRLLNAKGSVEFTEAWESVSIEFPNSMTPDTTSILDALTEYARKTSGGRWLLKPEVTTRANQHNDLIALIADIGAAWGYQVWIGRKEQSAQVGGTTLARRRLADLVTADLSKDRATIVDLATAQQIDCIWVGPLGPVACFEVESTTSMTSALVRGSNLAGDVRRYMVIPEERTGQLQNKMRSPLFAERFESDGWRVLYFDHLFGKARALQRRVGAFDALERAAGDDAKPVALKPKQMALDLGGSEGAAVGKRRRGR